MLYFDAQRGLCEWLSTSHCRLDRIASFYLSSPPVRGRQIKCSAIKELSFGLNGQSKLINC